MRGARRVAPASPGGGPSSKNVTQATSKAAGTDKNHKTTARRPGLRQRRDDHPPKEITSPCPSSACITERLVNDRHLMR